ncbi:hypothetical protein A3A79_05175 [Candidatus Gottesmanbacteria bacterium RIFCSPLOWO2_01_FULL_43_11b]|uniref:Uncharacterized protein n=1 Tax=Candidatus Gottesmanbacteria bacterium RIFCSPLOWO2_01_FULL_43_11b TaxID=1798392 RepID=A0A1F6AJX7_9BACT|nr:MAG: hypothetical protein A3A79_05175 [Candidatus Gottesmanbacteria bacterium RIFCSPLOWO2_01_FULL_43_11b]
MTNLDAKDDLQGNKNESARSADIIGKTVKNTVAVSYGAFQGECLQMGPRFIQTPHFKQGYPNYSTEYDITYILTDILPSRLSHMATESTPQPYHLYGFYYNDHRNDTSTAVMAGNISWERAAIYAPKGIPSGRTSAASVLCLQIHPIDAWVKFLEILKVDPTNSLMKFLKHEKFDRHWIIPNPDFRDPDKYARSRVAPAFKLQVDNVLLQESQKPIQLPASAR